MFDDPKKTFSYNFVQIWMSYACKIDKNNL
jgi:hypothetical protein